MNAEKRTVLLKITSEPMMLEEQAQTAIYLFKAGCGHKVFKSDDVVHAEFHARSLSNYHVLDNNHASVMTEPMQPARAGKDRHSITLIEIFGGAALSYDARMDFESTVKVAMVRDPAYRDNVLIHLHNR